MIFETQFHLLKRHYKHFLGQDVETLPLPSFVSRHAPGHHSHATTQSLRRYLKTSMSADAPRMLVDITNTTVVQHETTASLPTGRRMVSSVPLYKRPKLETSVTQDDAYIFLRDNATLDANDVDLKRLRRKIDKHLLPLCFCIRFMQGLDGHLLNYAIVMGKSSVPRWSD